MGQRTDNLSKKYKKRNLIHPVDTTNFIKQSLRSVTCIDFNSTLATAVRANLNSNFIFPGKFEFAFIAFVFDFDHNMLLNMLGYLNVVKLSGSICSA